MPTHNFDDIHHHLSQYTTTVINSAGRYVAEDAVVGHPNNYLGVAPFDHDPVSGAMLGLRNTHLSSTDNTILTDTSFTHNTYSKNYLSCDITKATTSPRGDIVGVERMLIGGTINDANRSYTQKSGFSSSNIYAFVFGVKKDTYDKFTVGTDPTNVTRTVTFDLTAGTILYKGTDSDYIVNARITPDGFGGHYCYVILDNMSTMYFGLGYQNASLDWTLHYAGVTPQTTGDAIFIHSFSRSQGTQIYYTDKPIYKETIADASPATGGEYDEYGNKTHAAIVNNVGGIDPFLGGKHASEGTIVIDFSEIYGGWDLTDSNFVAAASTVSDTIWDGFQPFSFKDKSTTGNEYGFGLYFNPTTAEWVLRYISAARTIDLRIPVASVPYSTSPKIALSWQDEYFNMSINGVVAGTVRFVGLQFTSSDYDSIIYGNKMNTGADPTTTNDSQTGAPSVIRKTEYYPRAMSDAELIAATT